MKDKHKLMYMRVAEAVALTSSATRLNVGAVIVNNNKIISTGYNALPSCIDGDCEYKSYMHLNAGGWLSDQEVLMEYPYVDASGYRYKLVTKPEVRHAEKNAILNLAKSTESSNGSALFCTHACCRMCSLDIIDAGIKEFYYLCDYRDSEGLNYLRSFGVTVTKMEI